MKVGYKVWIDNDGKAFGEGPYQVLRQIEQTGSLHKAAIELNMSYRKAWLMIKAIEKRLGFPLLERKVGGVSGDAVRRDRYRERLVPHRRRAEIGVHEDGIVDPEPERAFDVESCHGVHVPGFGSVLSGVD